MNFKDKYGNTAMVAGASEGLGAAYANALAAKGFDLVLIARRWQALEVLADSIKKKFSVKIILVVCDISADDALQQIINATADTPIDFMVFNAAACYIGPFEKAPLETHLQIARLNAVSSLSFVHHFGSKMVERKRGGIIIMTSLAGFQGAGYVATYGATKAFNRVLAEGLWYEWKDLGVDVVACCCGPIDTPNFTNNNPVKASIFEPKYLVPENVVKEALDKIGKVPSFVCGRAFRVANFFMQHLLPRKTTIKFVGDGTKKMFDVSA
ncbi:hypothetical protein GA0116948_10339 [Chitinophaga costaii]|uniref:Short-chain dehydrogenase n=1 Tax=Chitinophaga costaii TaxID=1335309 RepID=A0A1C4BCT2_9BACT|nr:SDR family NAD(P)-dependent oxidoreductase [Chitinophaga costaii]PUZ27660.1 KR domain-containing protein [Chitinophaga costaii]SCC04659.1 hypothetical protein GA0116948_10339 [Chitinophaga costaii]